MTVSPETTIARPCKDSAELQGETMSTKSKDCEKELRALTIELVESVAEASNEEVLDDLKALGEDPEPCADRVRQLLVDAIALSFPSEPSICAPESRIPERAAFEQSYCKYSPEIYA